MRFAAIADIHGNFAALEAVLADIDRQGIDDIVNLGDLLSGPLEPAKTVELLMRRSFPTIRGNHERWLCETPRDAMGASDAHAYDEISTEQRSWLADLPATMVYREEVFLCHGTPSSDVTYWLEALSADSGAHLRAHDEIAREAQGLEYPLILCAHTHIPRVVQLRDGRTIVNPGSVGCPGYRDSQPFPHVMQSGTPNASYAVFEKSGGRWSVGIRSVPYDHKAMAVLAATNGQPGWARALETGWMT